jgi:putative lipoprotein (rSAM/lipoprotein system)
MAPIKLKFLNSYNSLILFILSLLGFSTSCKKEEPLLMYGTPHATFSIVGEVKSATDGKVIPEIIVEVRKEYNEETGLVRVLVETGFSEDNGKYNVMIGDDPVDQTYQLIFTDTDGALNGEFESLDTTVVFKDPKFANGDGSWFRGVAEQEMNIELKPRK